MSLIFIRITEWKKIIETTNEYWFENLNLRQPYKSIILKYIKENLNSLYLLFEEIYVLNKKDKLYKMNNEIIEYCENKNIKYTNYFKHEEAIKKTGKLSKKD